VPFPGLTGVVPRLLLLCDGFDELQAEGDEAWSPKWEPSCQLRSFRNAGAGTWPERTAAAGLLGIRGGSLADLQRRPCDDGSRRALWQDAAMRIGILGLGWVGASVAISVLHRGIARELWLDDVAPGLAEAEAMDLAHGASFYPRCAVRRAAAEEMASACDAIVIAAGQGAMPGRSRLDALASTAAIAADVGKRLRAARGVLVVVTNPVDVVTQLFVEATGLPNERVLGTGTMLDTARLGNLLSARLAVDERSVHAQVLGEHGDSQVVAWSTARVGGVALREWPQWQRDEEALLAEQVRKAAYTIIAGKGATNHAIGLVTASLLQSVLRDERRVLLVSSRHEDRDAALGGGGPVCLSLPTVVGRAGAERVLLPRLDAAESTALQRSAAVLRQARASLAR
jgi:L-lactate dehydrogenase